MLNKFFINVLKYSFVISVCIIIFLFGYISHKYNIYPSVILETNLNVLKLKGLKNPFIHSPIKPVNNFNLNQIDNTNYKLLVSIDTSDPAATYIFNTETKKVEKIISKNQKVLVWEKDRFVIQDNEILKAIDFDNNLIWQEYYPSSSFHHWGDVNQDYIFLLTKKFVPKPDNIIGLDKCTNNEKIFSDIVVIIDKNNGKLIKELDLLNILKNYPKIFNRLKDIKYCNDPLHANDVRYISDKNSKYYKNLIISSRWNNLIFIVNIEKENIEYYLKDLTIDQHSPRILNDQLYVFDNMGLNDNYKFGLTRVLQIDMNSNKIVGSFSGNDKYFFEATAGGRINIEDDRLFILDNNRGELVMLDCDISLIRETCPIKKIYTTKKNDENKKIIPIFFADVIKD